jgi:two-component system cell cycle response regulator DivK
MSVVAPSNEQSGLGALVLLVEDHADTRALYAFDLTHAGFRVAEARNAVEALQRIATNRPDIVVTDLRMPGVNGVTLCRSLQQDEATRDLPLIAITAYAHPDMVNAARDAGCATVLLKPCAPAHLRREIARVVEAAAELRRTASVALDRAHAPGRKSAAVKTRADAANERARRHLEDATEQLALRVRAEFQENPGLRLSARDLARFMGLDEPIAVMILEDLVRAGSLRKTTAGIYFCS